MTAFVVLALVATAVVLVVWPKPGTTIEAEFAQAEGIHPGSKVAVLGVPLGHVESVRPNGLSVTVRMTVPRGTKIPANVEAWLMSPAVISDQYVELSPAYTTGEALPDGGRIPVERTHAPVRWDKLMSSIDSLLVALGPDGANADGSLGKVLESAAALVRGRGPQFNSAITSISQASTIVATSMGDVQAVLTGVDKLVKALNANKSGVDSLAGSVNLAAAEFAGQRRTIADTITALTAAMSEVGALVRDHGATIGKDVAQLARIAGSLAGHQNQLAEVLDTMPLAMDNLSNAISPEHKLRIRLDFSTTLTQFPAGQEFCRRWPIPLCSGAGLVNPIHFPPRFADPLGLSGALGGGR
ncbi:phospholipid/cholesterol/gamma-HCH transport system substrate-binding protein [Herbihabitans rhizosphaerae]|uniref:Phospholipid/cholesterol/gamma-HCH transport system substrate-binding protein n=1 Tax=Herbihabitans rhizosphaerae TaxID=1872711 RepID=A0A4Q7KDC8_9PSEU|nr:phospholipid/cholesterol/gamma-HCH transport system substrate-binding protein [Herbihabitans rhizosphaerae]